MRQRKQVGLVLAGCTLLATATAVSVSLPSAVAQTGKSKTKVSPTAVRQLDTRVTELQGRILKDAIDIAKGYEDAGEYDRAKWMLEVLEKLDPKLPGLKEKLRNLTDKSLEATEFSVDLDASKGWSPAVGTVETGRLVRITADGTYKLVTTTNATADGLPVDESGAGLVPGAAIGALVGVITDPKTRKPGKPFEIKAEREWTPRESGLLQLKLNLPSDHKSTGKITVRCAGVAPVGT